MSFKDYSVNLSKKFVGLFFSEETNTELRHWALSQGFDLTKSFSGDPQLPTEFDFHTTIFFTTTYHTTENGDFDIPTFTLRLDHFELLGENKNIPVIKIDTNNEKLLALREEFVNMGYQDAWPEYKPHISLSYSYSGIPKLSNLTLPDIQIKTAFLRIRNQ